MKHYKSERTLILIKPDGLQRSLVGELEREQQSITTEIANLNREKTNKEKELRDLEVKRDYIKS